MRQTKYSQQAKQAAQRIYKRVNYDGGNLQSYELSSLMQQTYDFLKIPFKPTTNDLKEYMKVLDANGDGAVSLQDLETLAVEYLCGNGVLGETGLGSKATGGFNESQYSAGSYQAVAGNTTVNDYTSYAQTGSRAKVESQDSYNYGGYLSGSQYGNEQNYTNSAYNAYGGYQNESYGGFSGSGVGNYQQSTSAYNSLGQSGANKYGTGSNAYGGSGFTAQSYGQNQYLNNFGQSGVSQTSQHLISKQSNTAVLQQKSKYTQVAQNYLNITRSLFSKYSNANTHTITRDKVAVLLNQTYSALGRKGYYPSEEDVNVWMKLCDTNNDGHVEEAEYEYFVVRALERSGVQVNA